MIALGGQFRGSSLLEPSFVELVLRLGVVCEC